MRARRQLLAVFVLLLLIGCAAPSTETAGWQAPPDAITARGTGGIVVTADRYATAVGLEVLESGGNAVDAAVATSLALAVTYPTAGNIGGGGFMVLRLADGRAFALDYREKAPAAASRDMFLAADGELTDRSVYGALAAGVPGSVMGLWEAHRAHGRLPWPDLVEPAIRLADDGFAVHESLHGGLQRVVERLAKREGDEAFGGTRDVFLPDGEAPELGSTFRQPDLARTLRRISEQGPDGFYRGETAELIVAEMQRNGGLISREDLKSYRAEWRDPIVFDYRDHTVISMPPVSSGGATLAQIANILEGFDLPSMTFDSPERIHLLVEAMKRAYSDRNAYLGDPAFVDMPLEKMISEEYAATRRSDIKVDAATPSHEVGPALGPVDSGDATTHFSIVDGDGNAVSVTTTINTGFGSLVTVRGAGFLLNNEMDDFAAKPGYPNHYGLVQGEANAIAGGKRMLSSMTPTIVLDPDDRLFLVTGTPGGGRIINVVWQTISNAIDHDMDVASLVHAPRVHHQHLPDRISIERDGFHPDTHDALTGLGHTLHPTGGLGDVQAIRVLPDGTLTATADPRGHGTAAAF